MFVSDYIRSKRITALSNDTVIQKVPAGLESLGGEDVGSASAIEKE